MATNDVKEHSKHVVGGYFKMGCELCERFIEKYRLSGRKFKIEK